TPWRRCTTRVEGVKRHEPAAAHRSGRCSRRDIKFAASKADRQADRPAVHGGAELVAGEGAPARGPAVELARIELESETDRTHLGESNLSLVAQVARCRDLVHVAHRSIPDHAPAG